MTFSKEENKPLARCYCSIVFMFFKKWWVFFRSMFVIISTTWTFTYPPRNSRDIMSSKTFACRSWRIILGRSANTEAPCHSRCGTIKIPPCSNAVGVGHRTQICSNSTTRVTSPYEWRLHMSARFSSGTLKTKRPPPPHFPWFKWLGGGGLLMDRLLF